VTALLRSRPATSFVGFFLISEFGMRSPNNHERPKDCQSQVGGWGRKDCPRFDFRKEALYYYF